MHVTWNMIWVKLFKQQTSAGSYLTESRVGSKAKAGLKEYLVTVQFPSEQLRNLPSHGHSARATLNENHLMNCNYSSGNKKTKRWLLSISSNCGSSSSTNSRMSCQHSWRLLQSGTTRSSFDCIRGNFTILSTLFFTQEQWALGNIPEGNFLK